ncbi:MAG: ABC transporter substrate-binding protein [Spirochaetaceae bacterium]|nr:MAG: ABC transporter substrate-binding protein [Spirochaetaceae bacterium]
MNIHGTRICLQRTFRRPLFLALSVFMLVCALGLAVGQREPGGQTSSPGGSPTETASGSYPVEMADDTGYTVRLNSKPERIISLTSFTDDILLDLIEHRRLIGVTNYSKDPAISNVVDKIADVPHKLTINVEVILSLQPDLVFVANWSEADKVAQLRDAGIPVYLIATGLSVEVIQNKIRTIARLVDAVHEGQAMIEEMDGRLAEIQRKVSTIPEQQRLTVMDFATWGSAQGAGSSWDEVIRRAGLINAVGQFAADEWGQVPLSKEKILELDPDLLILPGWVYGDPGGADAFYQLTLEDPALQGLSAMRQGRVYQMPEGLKAATSQYIVDAVAYLARLAYPQLFPD